MLLFYRPGARYAAPSAAVGFARRRLGSSARGVVAAPFAIARGGARGSARANGRPRRPRHGGMQAPSRDPVRCPGRPFAPSRRAEHPGLVDRARSQSFPTEIGAEPVEAYTCKRACGASVLPRAQLDERPFEQLDVVRRLLVWVGRRLACIETVQAATDGREALAPLGRAERGERMGRERPLELSRARLVVELVGGTAIGIEQEAAGDLGQLH